MSLYNSNYIKKTAIVKNIARTAIVGTVAEPGSLANGEVVVTDLSGNILDTTSVAEKSKIRVIQGRGASENMVSIELDAKNIVNYKGGAYQADQEEVAYFGFNGTSGQINAVASFSYVPFVSLTTNTMFLGQQNQLFWYAPYTSPATGATQAVVSRGIRNSFIANFGPQAQVDSFIKVERIADGAAVAVAETATVRKGSTTITFGGDVTIAAGTAIRLGAIAVLTNPIVVLTAAITAGTVGILESPWVGPNTVFTATTQVGTVAAPANWGIKLSGQPERFNIASFRNYDKITFTVGDTSGALTSEVAIPSITGSGTPAQVQIDESASWGFEGQQYLLGIPPTPRTTDVNPTGKYAALNIGFKYATNHMNGIGSVQGNILVYVDGDGASPNVTGTNATGAVDDSSVIDVLDAWAVAFRVGTDQVGVTGMNLA